MRLAMVAIALLVTACPPPPQTRVGLVDGARLVRVTKQGKQIRKQVEQEGARLTRELETRQQRSQALMAELEKLKKKLDADDPKLRQRQQALHKAEQALRVLHRKYRKQLNKYGERLLDEFKKQVRKMVMRIRAHKGLDLVIMTSRGEEQGLWVWPAEDITDDVVELMEREQ